MNVERARITEEVANFAVKTKYEDLSEEIQGIAKRSIVDGVGVILAGSTEPCAKIVCEYVLSTEGRKESTILGRGKNKAPIHLAALVNGTAGHAMDWDDTAVSGTPDRGVLLHPTLPPLVAGLAIGETLRVSGRDLLVAFLVGFEVECKMAAAIDADHRVRGFHTSGTCGIFGATVTAAKIMGLGFEHIRNALGIAASMAAGIDVQLGTMAKPLHVGRAAENGIVSAKLAALGYEANPEALEGPKGFFQAYGGGFDPDRISGKLGRPFSIQDPGVSIKPYPCGVVGQPGMDGMRALVNEHDIQPEAVKRVKVSTSSNIIPPKGPLRYRKAQSTLEAKFCVPFQMASMIIRRRAGMLEFNDGFVRSTAVQEMMDRVDVSVDPELDGLGRNKYVNVIELELKDGRIIHGRSPEHLRGGPRNPLSREELRAKFKDCVQGVLDPGQAGELLEIMESLEELEYVGKLIERAAIA